MVSFDAIRFVGYLLPCVSFLDIMKLCQISMKSVEGFKCLAYRLKRSEGQRLPILSHAEALQPTLSVHILLIHKCFLPESAASGLPQV